MSNWQEATRQPCPRNCGEDRQTEYVAGGV